MTKIFEYNSIDGNLNDKVSGDLLTTNNVVLKQTEKGLSGYFNGNNSYIIPPLASPTNAMTLICEFRISEQNNGETMRIVDRLGTVGYTLQISTGGALFFSIISNSGTSITATGVYNDNIWHQVIVTYDTSLGSDNIKMYIDGKINITGNKTDPITYTGSPNYIGSRNSTDRFVIGYINNVTIYEDSFTALQVSQEYEKFLQARMLAVPKRCLQSQNEGISLYKLNGNTEDSLSGFNGTNEIGVTYTENYNGISNSAMLCDPSNFTGYDINQVFTLEDIKIVEFKARFVGDDLQFIIQVGEDGNYWWGSVTFKFGYLWFGYFKFGSSYNVARSVNIYSDNQWRSFKCVFGNFEQGGIKNFKLFVDNKPESITDQSTAGIQPPTIEGKSYVAHRYLKTNDIRNSFLQGALSDLKISSEQGVTFYDKPKYEPADGTNIIPKGYIAGTGSYKAVTDSNGNQYYECTSAGTIAFQSSQISGTWEFDLYSDNNSRSRILFISDKIGIFPDVNSYALVNDVDEQIVFQKFLGAVASNLFYTSIGYLSYNTWYSYKINKTIDGKITTYIKGAEFGNDYILINANGSGTNPAIDTSITKSNYCVFDLDAGDRIRNVKFSKGII